MHNHHPIIYTLNRCPTRAVLYLTPDEAWLRYKPSVAHMRIFGCIAYAQVPKEKRKKLDDKSIKCILLGISYKLDVAGYLIPKRSRS
jgi:hypothetical protein